VTIPVFTPRVVARLRRLALSYREAKAAEKSAILQWKKSGSRDTVAAHNRLSRAAQRRITTRQRLADAVELLLLGEP
jgi:hypothetical protein